MTEGLGASRSGRLPWSDRRRGSPASSSASTTPAASGASGPTTTSSAAIARAARDDRLADRAGRPPEGSAPGAPRRSPRSRGATTTSFTPGSPASFQARACSRAPAADDERSGSALASCDPAPPACRAHRPPGPLDRLRPLGTHRDEHDRHAGEILDGAHVAPRVLGQVGEGADGVDRLVPAIEPLVDRLGAAEDGRPTTASDRPARRRSRTRRTAGSESSPDRMSSLLSMMLLTELTATA